MRVFQTIVELVTAIAWPVTVGGIAFLFRREVRVMLIARHVEGIERLNGIGLAARAVQSGVISPSTLESIKGVAVLRNLTAHGQAGDIDEVKARDYLSLVDGVIWTIRENSTRSQGH